MEPIKFSDYCHTLFGNIDDIGPLPIVTTNYEGLGYGLISCWRPSWREILQLIFTRRVYVAILSRKHPPMAVSADAEDIGFGPTERYWEEKNGGARSA